MQSIPYQLVLQYILLGGGATLLGTQILKSKYIPIQFEKYPRTTAAVVSLIAAILSVLNAHIAINLNSLPDLAALFIGTLWVAISTYNHLNLTKGQ